MISSILIIWIGVGIVLYLVGTHYEYDQPLVIWCSAAWPPAVVCILIGVALLAVASAYNYILIQDKDND